MGNARVSLWGGREHFITALVVEGSSEVCMYLLEWVGGSVEVLEVWVYVSAEAGEEG